jgi:hypothetical protein
MELACIAIFLLAGANIWQLVSRREAEKRYRDMQRAYINMLTHGDRPLKKLLTAIDKPEKSSERKGR